MVGVPLLAESNGNGSALAGKFIETVLTLHGKVQTQGRNIRHYTNYLGERARAFRDTKCDYVRSAERRLEKMSVDKGLLRETEAVQHQITSLLKCDVSKFISVWGYFANVFRYWTMSQRMRSQLWSFECWYWIFWQCSSL
jgi:hypothetical protein